ncbi:MAG: carboxypeptidase-like regulatory domain-containing protein, partial [Candidatus Cryptobacteroides sp.]
MKKHIILTLALTVCACLGAAAKNDWKGKVSDENGEPVPYATVALLSKADSSIVSGTVADGNGQFEIVTDRTDGIVMVSMIGYKTLYINPSENMEISLVPDGLVLEGAVATVVMPKTKVTGEGLQTAVRGSVLETVGTAKDVLERTPGLIKGQDGLEVIGKGSPMVYVNGRRVTDQTELERLQSNEIQNVEVITNPGAQYGAEVRSVVRIRTVRQQGEGFGFNAAFSDSQSLRQIGNNDPSGNLNLNYRIGSVDIFAGVNVFRYTTRQESDITTETYGTPTFVSDGSLVHDHEMKSAKTNLGINWQISENHSIGVKADWGTYFSVQSYQELTEKVERDGVLYDDIVSSG